MIGKSIGYSLLLSNTTQPWKERLAERMVNAFSNHGIATSLLQACLVLRVMSEKQCAEHCRVHGDPVSWASKKQRVVALSTCEAELYAEAAAIQEVLWLRGLMKELGLHTKTGSQVYGDNQSTIAVSHNGVRSERTKHVDVKYHFITETVEQGSVQLKWVPTTQQQADIFTKALPAPAFQFLRKQLMTR